MAVDAMQTRRRFAAMKPAGFTWPGWRLASQAADASNLRLLVYLRWLAVAGQIAAIVLVSARFGIVLPLAPMAGILACVIAVNVVVSVRYRHAELVSNGGLLATLAFDVVALTGLLYLSGGQTNPFISLYLLQVILAAVLLETWSAWAIVVLAALCYLALTVWYLPLDMPEGLMGGRFDLHVRGMFICFLLAALLLTGFIGRINANLRARNAHLARLSRQAAEDDHIVRIGLLASGAAHELGTPLSTISVLLGDWQKAPEIRRDAELMRDVAEMQAQLGRCKSILSGILLAAGEARGEGTVRASVRDFLDGAVADWRTSRSPACMVYRNRFSPDTMMVADLALQQVLHNVFDNALEASPGWVGITMERRGERLEIQVEDSGPGFTAATLEAIGRPYQSSKQRAGSGLGLFLVVNVMRKLGGTVTAGNRPEGGARVVLSLPVAVLSPEADHAG